LTERAISRSIVSNLPEGIESKYFPTPIEALIEYDLQKLQEEKQEVVEDDGNGQEEGSDVEKEESIGKGPPGSDYEDAGDEYPYDFEDEDVDAIILGVRIYTKGVAASVTGNVLVGQVVICEDGDGDEDGDEEKENEEVKDKNLKKKATEQKGDKQGS